MTGASLPQAEPRQWTPTPGPIDRQSFFEAQRRNRRATWRLALLCLITILTMGVGLSLIMIPLLLMQLLLITAIVRFLGVFVALPELILQVIEAFESFYQLLFDPGQSGGSPTLTLVLIIAPGMVAIALIFLALRSLFLRSGVGGALLRMNAREPRRDDLEEQQLINVVAEMAIAAGIRPPHVMLLDASVPNAAAIGASRDSATVVVSRRLLDEFDRDETQGVLGHLVGSIGNGDLRIAFTIVCVFQTFGVLIALLDFPFSARARATIRGLLRLLLRRGRQAGVSADEEFVTAMLSRSMKPEGMDALLKFMGGEEGQMGFLRGLRVMVYLPWILANIFSRLVLFLPVLFLLGPLIAFTWRTRRYLADATAVQLTRNPAGLSRALEGLVERGGVVPGTQMVSHLFIVGHEATAGRAQVLMAKQVAEAQQRNAGKPLFEQSQGNLAETLDAQRRHAAELGVLETGTFADEHMIVVSFHPSLQRRLNRLSKLGATAGL